MAKQPHQRDTKNLVKSDEQEQDVVVEEDKLDFETFKANYTEFVTIRKLVQAIKEKVDQDIAQTCNVKLSGKGNPKNKENKQSKNKQPKTIQIDLDPESNKITKASFPNKPKKNHKTPRYEEEVDENMDENELDIRARTSRQMEFKKKNNLRDSDNLVNFQNEDSYENDNQVKLQKQQRKGGKPRATWSKTAKAPLFNSSGISKSNLYLSYIEPADQKYSNSAQKPIFLDKSSTEELDDMLMLQKKIQMIKEEEEESSVAYPAHTPEVPQRFTIHHNKEEQHKQRVEAAQSPDNSDEIFSSPKAKYVLFEDRDRDKIYDVSQNEFETPVRLNDIDVSCEKSGDSNEDSEEASNSQSHTENVEQSKILSSAANQFVVVQNEAESDSPPIDQSSRNVNKPEDVGVGEAEENPEQGILIQLVFSY
jgi:nucleoid DNA-binding protein